MVRIALENLVFVPLCLSTSRLRTGQILGGAPPMKAARYQIVRKLRSRWSPIVGSGTVAAGVSIGLRGSGGSP